MADPAQDLRYKRMLLKLSGEALMGSGSYGIDMGVCGALAEDIREVVAAGVQVSVVVGGGNIFRGLAGVAKGMDRATADYMGMLATVMNALAFRNALEQKQVPARVLSAIPMPTVCEDPRSASLVTTAGLMSTQMTRTEDGSMLPTPIPWSMLARISTSDASLCAAT